MHAITERLMNGLGYPGIVTFKKSIDLLSA